MIEIFINGQLIDSKIENEETVGDILQSFEMTCEENDAAVIGILVDGKQITAEIFDEESERKLGNNTRFDFTVITKNEIKDSFKKLSELFSELSVQMEKVPEKLQNGEKKEVSESIKQLADNINQFCHVATLATLFPETFSTPAIDGFSFDEFFRDFAPILKEFEEALQKDDSVTIGDLSEYEICPRLQSMSETLKKM